MPLVCSQPKTDTQNVSHGWFMASKTSLPAPNCPPLDKQDYLGGENDWFGWGRLGGHPNNPFNPIHDVGPPIQPKRTLDGHPTPVGLT